MRVTIVSSALSDDVNVSGSRTMVGKAKGPGIDVKYVGALAACTTA